MNKTIPKVKLLANFLIASMIGVVALFDVLTLRELLLFVLLVGSSKTIDFLHKLVTN